MTDARARVEALAREIPVPCACNDDPGYLCINHSDIAAAILAYAATVRREENEACERIVDGAYVLTFTPEVRHADVRAISIANGLSEIASHIRARRPPEGT